ncbi:MATE family efflux transporter [Roseovarius spongiae]|uniref:MATE family efflux transporter n=1 Tax=Roseovarius spongiae TaxID=2320272 RepID=A0A3A8AXX9_9RHOB|nr:MATE family efflux transporter [Roseovarius spongiae]RKF16199.1 MATE family efflux transporter [Roseovarius spongiae]
MSADRSLTDGPVGRALYSVSAPMTVGILGVLSVGLADAFFLGRAGTDELAAIGFVFPVIATLTSLSIGLSAGTSAVIAQAIGGGATGADQQRLTVHAMMLAAALSGVAAVLFFALARWLFMALGAGGAVLDAVLGYVGYWCIGFPFMVTGMALNARFRAAGRSGVAATVMSFQALLNVALDPLFIFGAGPLPPLGADGAGIATTLARLVAFAGILTYGMRRDVIRFDCAPLRGLWPSVRRIVRIGAPAALSNAIGPFGMALVTGAIATIGDTAVAGFGAATRVQGLMMVPMLALSSGIAPVVGQAWGAGRQARAQEAVRLTFLWCLGLGLGVAVLLTALAGPIAMVMTADAGAARYAAAYLRVVSWAFFCYGILITANSAMNARDRALWSMGVSMLRIFVLYVPMVWAGVLTMGYGGVLAAAVLANALGAWGALIAVRAVGLLATDRAALRAPAEWVLRRLGRGPIDRARPLG